MSSSRSASMMFILRNSWRCGTRLQHVTGLWDRRAAAAVQKSWPDDQQPPQKSLFGEPPPDEDQREEWRLPPTIYQNKPAWCEEICERIYRIWTQWHLVDQHRSDPPLNPQDGSRFSPFRQWSPTKDLQKQSLSLYYWFNPKENAWIHFKLCSNVF